MDEELFVFARRPGGVKVKNGVERCECGGTNLPHVPNSAIQYCTKCGDTYIWSRKDMLIRLGRKIPRRFPSQKRGSAVYIFWKTGGWYRPVKKS